MPYRITWEPDGVYRTYFGVVTDSERRESLAEICGDRRFDDLRYAITDFLEIADFIESAQATLELAAFNIAPLVTNSRLILAAVAIDPRHIEYVERIRGLGLIKAPYECFPTVAEARRWIAENAGIPVQTQSSPVRDDA